MKGIKATGTRFEVFKGFALTTKSGLLAEDLVWFNDCVTTSKEHLKELKEDERRKEILTLRQKKMVNFEKMLNSKGPFIRPKLRRNTN